MAPGQSQTGRSQHTRAAREQQQRLQEYVNNEELSPIERIHSRQLFSPEHAPLAMARSDFHPPMSSSDGGTYITSDAQSLSHNVPSLSSQTPTLDSSSVHTSHASARSGSLLFDPETGETLASVDAGPLTLPCVFDFWACDFTSDDTEEWKVHCLSHFSGLEPPRRTRCSLCDDKFSARSGYDAWDARLEHMAQVHYGPGESLDDRKPEYDLIRWLFQNHLIDTALYKELQSSPLGPPRETYTVSAGSASSRRPQSRAFAQSRM